MKNKKFLLTLIAVFSFIVILYPHDAYAYINPGSGSDFFQMVMSFFAGITAGIKALGNKIKSFFTKNKKNDYE